MTDSWYKDSAGTFELDLALLGLYGPRHKDGTYSDESYGLLVLLKGLPLMEIVLFHTKGGRDRALAELSAAHEAYRAQAAKDAADPTQENRHEPMV